MVQVHASKSFLGRWSGFAHVQACHKGCTTPLSLIASVVALIGGTRRTQAPAQCAHYYLRSLGAWCPAEPVGLTNFSNGSSRCGLAWGQSPVALQLGCSMEPAELQHNSSLANLQPNILKAALAACRVLLCVPPLHTAPNRAAEWVAVYFKCACFVVRGCSMLSPPGS